MTKPNDGGPFNPCAITEFRTIGGKSVVVGATQHQGVSTRMWLAGTLSLSNYDERLIRLFSEDPAPGHGVEETLEYTATLRLRNADALIAREASTRLASQPQ